MKRFFAVLLALCLAGCSAPASVSGPAEEARTCRIADGAESDSLLLAEQRERGSLYRMSVTDVPVTLDGKEASATDLRDGMLVTVYSVGGIQESYPGGFYQVTRLEAVSEGADDRVGLALQALEDLWSEDTALNENIEQLSVYIDEALVPNAAERAAAAWSFAEQHQLPAPLTYDWKELCDEGYVNEEELSWETGCYLELKAKKGSGQGKTLRFDAQKWRGGLAAIFYEGCTAKQDKSGGWTYERGTFAIA
ncbi:MAG TPA: hypothetical protein IAA01_06400 [Candidatus Fournierella excrementavium]|nr:hypothetical protein [Candidatus Fournierella excrementavium]